MLILCNECNVMYLYVCLSGGRSMQSVGDWLESLAVPQYENTLVANGFDDMDFMVISHEIYNQK